MSQLDLFPDHVYGEPRPLPPREASHTGPATIHRPRYEDVRRPVTRADLEAAALERDRALLAYQAAVREFCEENPPPPTKWSNWKEAKDWRAVQTKAVRPALDRLNDARNRYRDLLCVMAEEEA